jgi:hypothetical protein
MAQFAISFRIARDLEREREERLGLSAQVAALEKDKAFLEGELGKVRLSKVGGGGGGGGGGAGDAGIGDVAREMERRLRGRRHYNSSVVDDGDCGEEREENGGGGSGGGRGEGVQEVMGLLARLCDSYEDEIEGCKVAAMATGEVDVVCLQCIHFPRPLSSIRHSIISILFQKHECTHACMHFCSLRLFTGG